MKGYAVYQWNKYIVWIGYDEDVVLELRMKEEQCLDEGVRTQFTNQVMKQITEYFEGTRTQFEFSYRLEGTQFQKQVWETLLTIPYGETRTYKEIAVAIGNPKACRAVGKANHNNPILIAIPCHRVIGSSGAITGYAAGVELKETLLQLEQRKKSTQ